MPFRRAHPVRAALTVILVLSGVLYFALGVALRVGLLDAVKVNHLYPATMAVADDPCRSPFDLYERPPVMVVSLDDGRSLWVAPRLSPAQAAALPRDGVLLVQSDRIAQLNLSDGTHIAFDAYKWNGERRVHCVPN